MKTNIYTAEYVLPGHPDKLCDAIADTLVEEAGRRERRALCGVEVSVHRASVFITGRIACKKAGAIDLSATTRRVFDEVGYGGEWGPAPLQLKIKKDLCLGPLSDGEAEFRRIADDQSIVTGYAINLPQTNYLPPEHWLAAGLARRFERLRVDRPELALGPDGKLILVYQEEEGKACVKAFSASLQQTLNGPAIELHRSVLELLEAELQAAVGAIPNFNPALPEEVKVNGAGNFAIGGTEGDNGLSGKKLVVDAYGPRVPIGGGALSGKDFYKADRAGAILARRLAKAVVMTGAAQECTATLAIFPGQEAFSIISLIADGARRLDPLLWSSMFDLSLAGVGDRYTGSVSLAEVARHGHFIDHELPWERLSFDGRPAVSH